MAQYKDSADFFGNRPVYPYYHPGRQLSPQYDFYNVKKIYHKHLDSVGLVSEFTGILTITFFINTFGETAFHAVKAVDNNYQPAEVPVDLGHKIYETTQRYFNSWIPNRDEQGNKVNTRKFYSFRFNNGILQEIFPK